MSSLEPEKENRLIELAQAGDREAFCALARANVAGLLRAAAAFGADRSAAEDLAQETLLEAWRSLGRFDGRCRLGTWLFGILRNRWLKSLRKKKPPVVEGEVVEAVMAAEQAAPDWRLEQAEEAAQLRRALAALPDGQREVLELRFLGQASLEDIAKVLDCPLGTVKSRLHHGLEKLRQLKFD
jgi:RNA polymerase sigma-70 factor (ECF subfamily)